jgi:hypothetical protein
MMDWRRLPELLGPRIQETDRRLSSILMRFDNDLYLRVQVFRGGVLNLWFALFEASDGTVLRLPMAEAASRFVGGRGYQKTAVVGNPRLAKGNMEAARLALEQVKSQLGAKSGWMWLSAAVRPSEVEEGAPAWKAGAEFTVVPEPRGLFRPPDFSRAARRIIETLDDLRQLFLDSIAQSPAPGIQPR